MVIVLECFLLGKYTLNIQNNKQKMKKKLIFKQK